MIDQARYNCSAKMTRTKGCGRVIRPSDHRAAAVALSDGCKPSGPPITKAMLALSLCHWESDRAISSVDTRSPSTSKATTCSFGFNRRSMADASSDIRLTGASRLRLDAGNSTQSMEDSRGKRFRYSLAASLTHVGIRVPMARIRIH